MFHPRWALVAVIFCFVLMIPAARAQGEPEATLDDVGVESEEFTVDEYTDLTDEELQQLDAEITDPSLDAVTVDTFVRAEVVEVLEEGETDVGGVVQSYQRVKLRITHGPEAGTEIEIDHGGELTIREYQMVRAGQQVVLLKNTDVDGEVEYYIADSYRLPALAYIGVFFLGIAVLFGRWRGFTAILGMVVSIIILATFIIPRILHGSSPLGMSVIGAVMIAIISLYLAHGFNRNATVALASTLMTLGLAIGLAWLFVTVSRLSGVGSEDAFYLQFGPLESLNLKGLLLGGIIIGALGVLDDITTAQTAAVAEIHAADPTLPPRELIRRGLRVGREHIASLVNTLVLAYAGTSFPLLLLFTVNAQVPLWVVLNGEFIAEEVIRTLVGSSALVLAVPISTALAARFVRLPKRAAPTQPPARGTPLS